MDSFDRKAVQSFLKSDVKCLLKSVVPEEEVQRHEELLSIFQVASDLAARLWSQKTEMVIADGARFRTENWTFDINSPYMEAHMSMGCDNESQDFDGSPIDLVLVPGVIAFGNSEGKMYSSSKVWMKSTVLVFAEDMLPAQSDSEGASLQENRNPNGRRSTPINEVGSDRPSKRIKTEKEKEPGLLATTAMTEPAKETLKTNLRANSTQKSSIWNWQQLSVCVPKKPSSSKLSASGLQCTPAAKSQPPQPEFRSPAPKPEVDTGKSGSLAESSSKPPPTHVDSMSGMRRPEADAKPQSRYQQPGKHPLPTHSKKLVTTTTTKTPNQRRRQMRRQKKKDAKRKCKRNEEKQMPQNGQTNHQMGRSSRANQSKK